MYEKGAFDQNCKLLSRGSGAGKFRSRLSASAPENSENGAEVTKGDSYILQRIHILSGKLKKKN